MTRLYTLCVLRVSKDVGKVRVVGVMKYESTHPLRVAPRPRRLFQPCTAGWKTRVPSSPTSSQSPGNRSSTPVPSILAPGGPHPRHMFTLSPSPYPPSLFLNPPAWPWIRSKILFFASLKKLRGIYYPRNIFSYLYFAYVSISTPSLFVSLFIFFSIPFLLQRFFNIYSLNA